MITKERTKEMLQTNLRDERMTSSALFINTLIERDQHGSGIERYRIKNTTSGEWVTSIEQFVDEIDAGSIRLEYPYEGERLQSDRVTGFLVCLDNFKVEWSFAAKSDKPFASFFDMTSQVKFMFFICYMNDGDTDVPLKISSTKLVK